jgi:hypothetical protein
MIKTKFELGIKDYKELIDEARADGFHNRKLVG